MVGPHDPLPDDVLDALRRGDAIDAIKRLRTARGLGLKEAKDLVDAHARGFDGIAPAPPTTRALPPDAARALARGDRIEAIRLARHASGLGLKEARDWVEAHEAVRVPTGLAPGEVPRSRVGWAWLAALAALAVLGYALLA